VNTAISDDQFGLLVERQRPLKEYRELVPDEATLLTGYADFLQRKFRAAGLDDSCVDCGGQAGAVREFIWRAIFHSHKTAWLSVIGLLGVIGGFGWMNYNYVDARTHHALCPGCYRALCARRVAGLFVEKVCFAGLIISSGATVFLGALFPLLLFLNPKAGEVLRMGAALATASAGLWLSIIGTRLSRGWQIPARIRSFIIHPFHIK
jgi:hypothetical protein